MQAITRDRVIERMNRGTEMAREGGAVLLSTGEWVVPSSRGDGRDYTVNLEAGTCGCDDHRYRKSASGRGVVCKHITAARVAAECLSPRA